MESKYLAKRAPRGRWVIAHRGNSGPYPENTLRAFRSAVEIGADLIEIDVHLSADGDVIISHDSELGRTCTGTGKIVELSTAYLREQDAGSWKSPEFAGERLPLFTEFLAEIPLPVMVEIKPEGEEIVRRTIDAIREANAFDRVVLAAFSDKNLQWAAKYAPQCERLALGKPSMARMDNVHICAPHFEDADKTLAETLHKEHRALWCWTVDEPADIQRVLGYGVDGIISNWPERVFKALK